MEGRGNFTVVEGGTHFFFFLTTSSKSRQKDPEGGRKGERLTFLQGPGRASLLLRENMKE